MLVLASIHKTYIFKKNSNNSACLMDSKKKYVQPSMTESIGRHV